DTAARCRNVYHGAVVRVERAPAGDAVRGHRYHAGATCRGEAGGAHARVARGRHDHGATGDGLGDRVLVHRAGRTGAAAAEAQVDDLRRMRVGGHALHRAARGPDDRVADVAVVAAAVAEHADREHHRAIG